MLQKETLACHPGLTFKNLLPVHKLEAQSVLSPVVVLDLGVILVAPLQGSGTFGHSSEQPC